MNSGSKSVVRLVVQQCLSASLKLPDQSEIAIDGGMVVFVCFKQGAEEEDATKAADTVCAVKLCEKEEGAKRVSAAEGAADVLVVPQATLGGKLKGRALQYHGNVAKEDGERLYEAFCQRLRSREGLGKVESGVYGARQVLSSQTNGPFTHVFDL